MEGSTSILGLRRRSPGDADDPRNHKSPRLEDPPASAKPAEPVSFSMSHRIERIIKTYAQFEDLAKENFQNWIEMWPDGSQSLMPVLIIVKPAIPPLADPFQWQRYYGCRYQFRRKPGDNGSAKYYNRWKISESIGDKTLSKLVLTKLNEIGLPFALTASLQEWLTTNDMFQRWASVLPNSKDPAIANRLDDSYEVSPWRSKIPFRKPADINQVWNSIVQEDPLYLFTDLPYMDIVSDLIWAALSPLFDYLELLYGPVRRFDTAAPVDEWTSQIRTIDGTTVNDLGKVVAPNFRYGHCESVDLLTLEEEPMHALHKVTNLAKSSMKKVHLTVQVPAHPTDSYWTMKSYHWKPRGDRYQFSVTRFGWSTEDANWWATRFAMEIIRCARENGAPKRLVRYPAQDCQALRLGRELHTLWETGSNSFKDFSANTEFWSRAKSTLDGMIVQSTEFKLLLKYYQVIIPSFVPTLFSIIGEPFTESQVFPLLRMKQVGEALELLKEVKKLLPHETGFRRDRHKFEDCVERVLVGDEIFHLYKEQQTRRK